MESVSGTQGWFEILKSLNLIQHMNKLKKKNHRINSIDTEKVFYKTQHQFFIQTLSKIEIEGNFPNKIKGIYN